MKPPTSSTGRASAVRRRGDGPPLVLVNGFAATRDDWDPTFLEALERAHELIFIDHRGMGGTRYDGRPFTIEQLAADAAEVLDALAIQRPAVLGWSMGGFVALALALAAPHLVGKLVLLATSAGGNPQTLGRPDVQARLRDFSGTPRDQASRLISILFDAERARQVDAQFGEVVAAARAALPVDVAEQQWLAIEAWARTGVAKGLDRLDCPTLIATGDHDAVIPPQNSLTLAEMISGSWLVRFPRSGHGFIADYPETLASLIVTFLGLGWPPSGRPTDA